MKKLLAKIRKILHDRRTRQMLTRIVSVTAAIVVFITTYALVLPAITMESEANCGIEAHQHDESCYEDQLICGEIESPGHHHSEACYKVSEALVCEEQEHQHDDSCFDESGNLTCDQPEHTHDDTCYKESRELTCDIPESDGHQHSSACYERVLTCGKEIHTHSTACYEQASDTAASASADFAAVATTELGSSGATVSASTEIETESGESDAASSETSDAWTTEKNVEGEASFSTTTNVSTTAATTAGSSSTAAAAANTAIASTGNTAFDSAAAEDTYIPQLEPVIFEQLLTKDTDIYYYHAEEGQEAPESSADIADWKRVNDDTELTPADLLRVYLRYTIPAGTLNATNDIARYRLPSNLHLTDQQMETINTTVNGVANQYVSLDTLEITDTEKYNTYLGIEATEGTRKPSDDVDEFFADHPDLEGQEYINAVVRAENVFDDTTGEYAGQDLVFTFSPYTVQKNQHEYDADGQPTKAGQKVDGWLCFDLHMDQIDWSEPVITTTEDSVDPAELAQGESFEKAENSDSSDTTETIENPGSETKEEASASSSDPDALNANTLTEKKESSAEIIFAAKDKALKIDRISTELHLVEFNAIEAENDATLDEQDQSADDSTDSNKSEMTNADIADDSTSEGEADKNESADETSTAAGDQPESETEINAETYPAVSFEDTITVQAGTLTTDNETAAQDTPAETAITVSVIAEEETFPLGTTMQLGTVEDMDTVASAVEGTVGGQTRGFHAVDISFHNADGEEIEPLKPIKVSMTSDAIKQAVEDSSTAPVVVHVENSSESLAKDKDSKGLPANSIDAEEYSADTALQSDREAETSENTPTATIVETNETSSIDGSNKSAETADTLSFDAGSFSVYAIVYTVDFHYEINGEIYDFSIPGGGFVSLYNLIEVLGIEANDPSTEKDEIQDLIDGVESIAFSNPDLVSVSKIEEDTIVGAIKNRLGLECEYSAELTKEEIEGINAQEAKAGDWALISLKAFDTEESLNVTMKNGDHWVVKVTDANQVNYNNGLTNGYRYLVMTISTDGGNTYYRVLRKDGVTETFTSLDQLDALGADYLWTYNYNGGYPTWTNGDSFIDVFSSDLDTPVNPGNPGWTCAYTLERLDGGGYHFKDAGQPFYLGLDKEHGNQLVRVTSASDACRIRLYTQNDANDYMYRKSFRVEVSPSGSGIVWFTNNVYYYRDDYVWGDTSYGIKGYGGGTNLYTIAAFENSGYEFDHWELDGEVYHGGQDVLANDGTYIHIIEAGSIFIGNQDNRVVTAVFRPSGSLTITAGTGGTASPAASGINGSGYNANKITATADDGYWFDHWVLDGETVGTTDGIIDESDGSESVININKLYVGRSGDHTLEARFIPETTFDVQASDGGTVNKSTSPRTKDGFNKEEIKATASAGYWFDHWEVDGEIVVADDNPAEDGSSCIAPAGSIQVGDGKVLKAVFIPKVKYDVTVVGEDGASITNSGCTVKVGNSAAEENVSDNDVTYSGFNADQLTATAGPGYVFKGWYLDDDPVLGGATITHASDGSSSTISAETLQIGREEGHVVKAVFVQEYSFTVTTSPKGAGTVKDGDKPAEETTYGSMTKDGHNKYEIKATAQNGYKFLHWTMNGQVLKDGEGHELYTNGTIPEGALTITSSDNICAVFVKNTYTITVTNGGNGWTNVSTMQTESNAEAEKKASNTIIAYPNNGYKFAYWKINDSDTIVDWGNGYSATSSTIQPTVNRDVTVTAVFVPDSYRTFTVTVDDPRHGTVFGKDANRNDVAADGVSTYVARTRGSGSDNNDQRIQVQTTFGGYEFVGWELVRPNGKVYQSYKNNNKLAGWRIDANSLNIPFDNMTLRAIFKEREVVPFDDPTMDDLIDWANGIADTDFTTDKTAEVFDYDNRIYKISMSASSKKQAIDSSVVINFITDVSRSMYFPANIEEVGDYGNSYGNTTGADLQRWLNGKSTDQVYYIILSQNKTATMYAVYHDGSQWLYVDASYYAPNSDDGLTMSGTAVSGVTPANGDNYKIYQAPPREPGRPWSRLDYLCMSVETAADVIYTICPNAQIDLTTFNRSAQYMGTLPTDHAGIEAMLRDIDVSGGTRQDLGLEKALPHFTNGSSKKQVAVLITDGAPNPPDGNMTKIWQDINIFAGQMKDITDADGDHLELYTMGLSLKNVGDNEAKLNAVATEDPDKIGVYPNKYAKSVNSGQETSEAVKEIVNSLLNDVSLFGSMTDTVDPAFYPVDINGQPIQAGYYAADGSTLNSAPADNTAYYEWVNNDGTWTITWHNQTYEWPKDSNGNVVEVKEYEVNGTKYEYGFYDKDGNKLNNRPGGNTPYFEWKRENGKWYLTSYNDAGDWPYPGWKKNIYVKAKEDFLGGNKISTNDAAALTATGYVKTDTSVTPLASETTKTIEYTPYVNVDELHMANNDTEWTVYLGTNVDPKTQLKKLFVSIPVRQVVKEGGTIEDIYIASADQMYYEHETTVDNEDEKAPAEKYQSLPLSHYLTYGTSTSTNKNLSGVLDDLLETLKNSDTASLQDIVYTEYGHSAGYFTVTLTKNVNSEADADHAPEAHDTKKTGKEAEAYTVNVKYTPYTSTIPAAASYDHTTLGGTSGVITTGSGDDAVKSENSHKINVYSKPLDIMKVNEQGMPITAPKQAKFELLKVWNEGDSNSGKVTFGTTAGYAGYKLNGKSLDGKTYSVIDQQTTDENGIAHFGVDTSALLRSGEYILIEKEEPEGYEKDVNAKTISIETSDADLNFYSNLAMEPSLATMPYNWNQGVRFILRENDGETSSETVLEYVDGNGRKIKLYEPGLDETDENLRDYVFSNVDNNKNMTTDPNGVFRTSFMNVVGAIGVTFKKVGVNNSDETGTQSNLGGAKFTLYEATGENKDTKGSVVVIDNEAFQDKTSDDSSGVFWTGMLPIGNYLLEETEAPDGYTKIGVLIKVTVNEDGVSLGYVGTVGTPPFNDPTKDGDTWTITAINTAGVSLPSTGGPGTVHFYRLGLLLAVLASSSLAMRKRWRKAA